MLVDDQTKDVSLHGNDSSVSSPKPISYTEGGGKRRLDVNTTVTGSVTLEASNPRWDFDNTQTALTNGVDTSIFLKASTVGFIDFIQVICGKSTFEGIIIVDGVEQLRIGMSTLGDIGLLSSNSTNIPVYSASASKIWSLHPNQPFAFQSSFEIKIKATSNGVNLNGWMVSWRQAP